MHSNEGLAVSVGGQEATAAVYVHSPAPVPAALQAVVSVNAVTAAQVVTCAASVGSVAEQVLVV